MTARARLAAYVGSTEPLALESVQAIRAGAKRIHEPRLLHLADAALRELALPTEQTMPEINIPTDADAVHAMRQYGGSFVKQLAECWLVADVINKARVKVAFAEEFLRYRDLAGRDTPPAAAPNIERATAHYQALALEAADRTGETPLPEHTGFPADTIKAMDEGRL